MVVSVDPEVAVPVTAGGVSLVGAMALAAIRPVTVEPAVTGPAAFDAVTTARTYVPTCVPVRAKVELVAEGMFVPSEQSTAEHVCHWYV
mgnify:CR=1 FL=1